MNLKELKVFLNQVNANQSSYWESIFKSDMRNIFPKYQVCKIQTMKNQVSKIRLIMENINHFTEMQVQRSYLKINSSSISQNFSQEVNQLLKQCIKKNVHYNIDICSKKEIIQKLTKQFSKPLHLSFLKNAKKNQKWKQYILSHMENSSELIIQNLEEQKINIVQTFPIIGTDLDYAQNQLIQNEMNNWNLQFLQKYGSGHEGKVFQKRVKQKILIQQLVDYMYQQKDQEDTSIKSEQNDEVNFLEIELNQIKKHYKI